MHGRFLFFLSLLLVGSFLTAQSTEVQFIFTSDSHYGITRGSFRGASNVDAHVVNAALVKQLNRISSTDFPADGGLRSAQSIGPVDFLVDGGDIANREETSNGSSIQSAATSWSQFRGDYIDGLSLMDRLGKKTAIYVVPGNHDVSNAVGFYRPMLPLVDKTSMIEIFNLMMKPMPLKTITNYDFARDRVMVSNDIGGIHFIYVTIWPDTGTRAWMERDLKQVSAATPVIIFAHDPPDSDAKHFTNPNGTHDVNMTDKFENVLTEHFADELNGAPSVDLAPLAEQRAWESFLRQHPNITAYFHGHNNWNQFYDWTGPDHTVSLHTFRVDSPMKGHFSASDEAKLSFQIATIDRVARTMTVREVLWNTKPQTSDAPPAWGASTTVALFPRPAMKK